MSRDQLQAPAKLECFVSSVRIQYAVPRNFLKSKIHSTKIAKARPGFDDPPEHPSVQINSCSPRLKVDLSFYVGYIASKEYSIAVLSLRCLLIFSSKFVKSYGKLLSF